jgi:hypothetical protein
MKFGRMAYITVSVFLGMMILVISIARAGLEIMAAEGTGEGLRNDPIKFDIVNDLGDKEEFSYKLPEPGMLPNNPFYGFKKIRDFLWMKFSVGNIKRAGVELLVADKKMAEAKKLFGDNKGEAGLGASQEALDTLKLAERSISGVNEETAESKQIRSQVYKAGFAYRAILKTAENSFEMDVEKYNQLIKELDDWNQEQKSQGAENTE